LNILRRSTNSVEIFFAIKKIYELATTKKIYKLAATEKIYKLATTKKIYKFATTKNIYKFATTKNIYELATTKIYQFRCFRYNTYYFDSNYLFEFYSNFYLLSIDFRRLFLLEYLYLSIY